ncbi:MAG TPA: hypothetical protein VGD31_17375 [Sphingobacteriaceae bacterium]
MKEEKIGVEFLNPLTKEGYVKIPPRIREVYKLKQGDILVLRIERKIIEKQEGGKDDNPKI